MVGGGKDKGEGKKGNLRVGGGQRGGGGGVEVGRAQAGARAGSWEPAVSRRGKENDNSLDVKCSPPRGFPLGSSFRPMSEYTWAAPEMYLPDFYSPSSSHVPGAAGKVPVRPIAVDNLRHFPPDHGN